MNMSAIVICKVYVETICVVETASFDPLRKAKSVIFFSSGNSISARKYRVYHQHKKKFD